MKVLLFAGSLRDGSLNKKLTHVAANILKESAHEVKVVDLKPLQIPVYDADIESAGMPAGVLALVDEISKVDAIVISSPEYNGSMSGVLKNTLDWISRAKNPMNEKPVLLMSASPGGFGGIQGLQHARVPFASLGTLLYPKTFALPKAHEAFDESGKLNNAVAEKNLRGLIEVFCSYVIKLK